jgi:hypothetical protein
MQRLISCLQRRVTQRATATPKKAPPSPARKSKTATSPAGKPKTASSPPPKTKISSAASLDHILVTPTTPIKRTSNVRVGSTTPAISTSTSLRPRGDSVARGRNTTRRGTTQSAVSFAIPSPTASAVSGDSQSPRFDPFQINSSGSALQRPFFGRNDARDPSPRSLVDLNSRWPTCGAPSSPAHSFVRGTSPGN